MNQQPKNQNLAKPKFKFKNAVKLKINGNVFRKDILLALKDFDFNVFGQVEFISQCFNNNTWFISFTDQFNSSSLFGQKIKINDHHYEFQDPNEEKTHNRFIYRVLWLPHHFNFNLIRSFFQSNGFEVLDINEEFMTDEGFEKIKNGNIRVKVQIKIEEKSRVTTGINELNGYRVLITRIGEPVKCLICNEVGHIRKDCPKKEIFCKKCNKNGHVEKDCSFAQMIALNVNELPDEDVEGIAAEEINGNKQKEVENLAKSNNKIETKKADQIKDTQNKETKSKVATELKSKKTEIKELKTAPNKAQNPGYKPKSTKTTTQQKNKEEEKKRKKSEADEIRRESIDPPESTKQSKLIPIEDIQIESELSYTEESD